MPLPNRPQSPWRGDPTWKFKCVSPARRAWLRCGKVVSKCDMRKFLVFALCVLGFGIFAAPVELNQRFQLRVGTETVNFRPGDAGDLRRLLSQIDKLLKGADSESKHERRGLAEEIIRLAFLLSSNRKDPDEREKVELDLLEVVFAVIALERPDDPRHFRCDNVSRRSCNQIFRPNWHREKTSGRLLAPGPARGSG